MFWLGCAIGFIISAIISYCGDCAYRHTLSMIGERKGVERLGDNFYRIIPEQIANCWERVYNVTQREQEAQQ